MTLANKGYEQAIADDAGLRAGVNLVRGEVTNAAVAASLGLPHRPL